MPVTDNSAMEPSVDPCYLTAATAAAQIREQRLTCEALVRSCLERIEARDADIRAWSYLDPRQAIAQARELDKRPAVGPLHGLPFGVKDVIDTEDMPTAQNSPHYLNHRPSLEPSTFSLELPRVLAAGNRPPRLCDSFLKPLVP